jgi:hypothetical protein
MYDVLVLNESVALQRLLQNATDAKTLRKNTNTRQYSELQKQRTMDELAGVNFLL